jgi:hypothetical protein
MWKLTNQQFDALTQGECHYCGAPPSKIGNAHRNGKSICYGNYVYNGIDRVDNNQGYVEGNVVSCCHRCNHAKKNYSFEEFQDWIDAVYCRLHKARGVGA